MSLQRTMDQQRGAQALVNISAVKNQGFEKGYSTIARKFPVMVLTNGLGQSLAFLRAKSPLNVNDRRTSEHFQFYQHVSSWVTSQLPELANLSGSLLEKIIQTDSNHYRRATTETLAFSAWLKKWAEAELKEGE